ncbi:MULTISPECIES: hypothetical protein [Streptomyces]|uniref:Uncharacterized protein n=2 Tax=Streptomyces TaxID=1883 RepID=A0ABU4K3M4_9ACTN|nr:hypothetical protein [Streptomyces roseolus]MDX2292332.1 hypothetical protein [Streptomyces roseolus]
MSTTTATSVATPGLLRRIRALDWQDLDRLSVELTELLAELAADGAWLAAAMENLLHTPELRDLSERLAELDKMVLINDSESGVRIRLHRFRQGYFDRPHNHRFTFGARILSGGYRHTIYGDHPDPEHDFDLERVVPTLIRRESAGSSYVIQHTLVHSVAAEPETLTLTVRGPAQKDRMLIVDRDGGTTWWQFGVKDENAAEVAKRRLTDEQILEITQVLRERGLTPS